MDDLKACRLCLAIDLKMQPILNTNAQLFFQDLTGIEIQPDDGKPQYICNLCSWQLQRFHLFKGKCCRADLVLSEIQIDQIQVTMDTLMNVDRILYNLNFPLTQSNTILDEYPFNTTVSVKKEPAQMEEECMKEEVEEDFNIDMEEGAEYDASDVDSEEDVPLTHIARDNVQKRKKKFKPKQSNSEEFDVKRGFNEDYAQEIYLSREQQLAAMDERAKSLNYLNSPLRCALCFKGFVSSAAFNKHREKHDHNRGEYECEICHLRYGLQRQLRTHLATSHTRQYECKKCNHRSHTANQAREHEKWHKGHLYDCKLCGLKFQKPTTQLTHMRKHHASSYICDLCGEWFVGKLGLLLHKSKTHRELHQEKIEKNPECYCPDCDVQFVSTEVWKRHIVTSIRHHSDDRCKICDQTFVTKEQLANHMKDHAKQLLCTGSVDKSHVTLTRIACDQCSCEFVNRSKLQAHIRRKHLGLKYNKNVVCELCGKKCTSNATLKYHQRTHTGEKPFSCSDCPKRFSDNNQLRIHRRTHTDERPYSCHVCGKTFRQKPALNRHTRVHTGAKPYECQFCAKKFSQSNSMKLHVRTIHLKLPSNNRRNKRIDNAESIQTSMAE